MQKIFLDIACFFKDNTLGYVIDMLRSARGIQRPEYAIGMLIGRSLIKLNDSIQGKKIIMHDLIQDMGRKIVHQESSKEPGNRSKLWFHEDILHVLQENTIRTIHMFLFFFFQNSLSD